MTYAITDKCISCQRCIPTCPTNAIERNGATFKINADLCNNCKGFYSVPQCWAVCPTEGGCVSLSGRSSAFTLGSAIETTADYWKAWQAAYKQRVSRLKQSPQSEYWNDWFDSYSQSLEKLQAQAKTGTNAPLTP
ncbi:4Fe-4S binding domain protein [Synechococcus sp. PCC 7335]|uniref:4Fe-4S binding protein n=1 Tax=Synechococcus sp. (strain ATCC 29403 / PCC 7335) TaxID=91464 RepID=UPI00017EC080|nr:4Fe-4S binding protein [Synechococcus sp. PCC 7335]EDX85202.1 4Fe-4S binding domain protein [Synechococcus sp. PCC 7335]